MDFKPTALGSLALAALLASVPAFAQSSAGLRAGVSREPNQFVVGGHVETAPILEHVTFRPNFEIGFGDDVVLASLNFDVVYSVPFTTAPWRAYFGLGPTVNIWSLQGDHPGGYRGRTVGPGLDLVVGVQHHKGFFGEVKVGFVDSPELKVMVGYAFKRP